MDKKGIDFETSKKRIFMNLHEIIFSREIDGPAKKIYISGIIQSQVDFLISTDLPNDQKDFLNNVKVFLEELLSRPSFQIKKKDKTRLEAIFSTNKYQQETSRMTQNTEKVDSSDVDQQLLNLKEETKLIGVDTQSKAFQDIVDNYYTFFNTRLSEFNKDTKNFEEFMIRHNRFVPMFNLRHISPDLLEIMAKRFSRMKKEIDEIEKEYDKIEL